jgi:hypothetical protein
VVHLTQVRSGCEYSTPEGEKRATHPYALVNSLAFVVIPTTSSTQRKISAKIEPPQYMINWNTEYLTPIQDFVWEFLVHNDIFVYSTGGESIT